MGYIFTILVLLAGATKGFCGKKISGDVSTLKGTFYMNMTRMLLCIVIGFFIVLAKGTSSFITDAKTLLITFVSGISTAMSIEAKIENIHFSGYSLFFV